ncbi:MAG: GntR family transcriptional regulator [Acidobacteriia bacterium]|nr:GntR family transcriptional regulator [Terriglobia bacterium]
MATRGANRKVPKYQQVLDVLQKEIVSGGYLAGQRFPSEAMLVKKFGTSRITVGRAVRELERRGLVERRAGSGTYVRAMGGSGGGLLFGLLIPDLGTTEIFEPICQGIAGARAASNHALLWGNAGASKASTEEQAWQLCRQFIDRNVAGVFFAPLERSAESGEANRRIVAALESARIPVVLLDRCILPYPQRSKHDLVGIDNRRAGYTITAHLLELGCRRIAFAAYPDSAPTVEARMAGYREALAAYGAPVESALVWRLNPAAADEVGAMLKAARAQAFVCANDRTAGQLMRTLMDLGHRIPEEVRLVGIDDVKYASLLPVPLTTIRQPCREIGEAAMAVMLDRVARPEACVRDVLLDSRLVVRASCGAALNAAAPPRW